MAQVFAAHDIAVIAGAFRPDIPSSDRPSLIWNSSSDRLLQSTKIQDKFEQLLLHGTRIQLSSIPKSLDTRQIDWCIAESKTPLVYSSDRQSVLSNSELDHLLEDLHNNAEKQYIQLETFLATHDVDRASCRRVLEQSSKLQIVADASKTPRTWIASTELQKSTTDEIEELLRNSSDEHKTDLSAKLPVVPRSVILQLAEQLITQHDIKGTLRSGKTRITFMSAAYEEMMREQQAKQVAREYSKILVQTHRYGYHTIPEDTDEAPGLRDVFFERTKAGLDNGSFSMINSGDKPIALAFTNQLEVVLNEMKTNASDMVSESRKTNGDVQTSTGLAGRVDKLIELSSSPEFAKLVLQDVKYRTAIEQSMLARLDELEGADLHRCNEAFNEYVRLPMRLYLAGLNNVKDPALRTRLEDYVLEFLSKDLVPSGIQHSEDEKHLRNKPLGKELERFGQSCLESKSLYELQSGLSKFAKKQKLESVSMADELEVKHRILRQKLKAMYRMIRGSDILQNLVWILLAQEYEGLFISSGRDTTRMIRFYQSTGDAEIGKKLEGWKDNFKAGQEARQDFEDMRLLAESVVEDICKSVEQAEE